ncbi:MAG: Hpt domain-containing protein, partial [Pseudomonadota bacterium]|nr:Hpt domain-containing protein [Pseudomonadota bacterium]
MPDIIHEPSSSKSWEHQGGRSTAGQAALTEAVKHVDIIHTSLAGMTAIVLMLLAAVALPIIGHPPVRQLWAFLIMVAAALAGIGGLYYMNYRIHKHVGEQASLTEVLVNSLGQGFLVFDRAGLCGNVYSQACFDLLETIPAGKNVMDILKIPDDQRADFKDWMDIMFMPNHALGFDDVVKFMPSFYPHTKGWRINLMYRAIRTKDGTLANVVMIATDQTEEFESRKRIEQQRDYADMICRIFKERNQFLATITHVRKFIDEASRPVRREDASPLLRSLHTLKAAVKHFHLEALGETFHTLESDLRGENAANDQDFQARLRSGQGEVADGLKAILEKVHDLIGQDYEGRGSMHEVQESAMYAFAQELEDHNVDPSLIQSFLSTIAAVPANECFRLFERELHDLAEITGKQVKPVRFTGSNPRVLVKPIQEFLFSLTHICRNIIDHGIEPPVTRLARDKDPAGQIAVHINTERDDNMKDEWLHIVISDDGNGIDPARVRAKLAIADPLGDWRDEDDDAVIQRIFSW